ncbi:MAG: GNAT family N-acetyltransferase [Candidatus Aenigmarchaeota archaeon]|nr:GNAT family N-acetyltransferase [Candidatus Aenigmarchaeota archaeon]
MKIRKLREDDIPRIVSMIHDVMGPDDAKKALTDMRISLGEHTPYKFEEFYVLEINGEIVAAGGFWSLKYDPDIGRLDWFVVPRKHQRKGFGTMLMNHIVKRAKNGGLRMLLAETSDSRDYLAARQFLAKTGFRKTASIGNYWGDGSACVYFVKRLKKENKKLR